MRSTVSTIIFLLFATSLCIAQNFEITYPGQSAPYFWAEMDQTIDGGYIAASRGTHDFIKVDANGQFQWGFNAVNGGSDPTDGGGVLVLDDGSMILGGEQEQNLGYLTKVDANGQVIWNNLVIGGDVQGMTWGINGWFYVIRGCCGGTLQVSSYSSSGGHYWSRYFHKIQSIGGTSDGGVVVGGDVSGKHHVRKYDSDGNEVWSWTGTNDTNNGANSILNITEGEDGNIYAVGSINDNGFKSYLLILDSNGNFVNNYFLPGSYIQSIENSGDGNFIIAGKKGSAFLAKIDASADVIWERRIDGFRAQHAIPTSDGGAVVLVHAGNGETKITKTDAQGLIFNTFISGSIIIDQEGDCQFQNTDLPASPTVVATPINTGNKFYAVADQDGNFIMDCQVGNYEISTSLPSEYEPCESTIANMIPNVQTLDIGPKLYKDNPDPQGTIKGRVFIDNNNNCQFDAGDTPLECIMVPITWEGQFDPIFYGETDENGFYSFEVPGDHNYYPYGFFSTFWGVESSAGCFFNGDYLPSYDTITLNYSLAAGIVNPAYISGHVYIDENENCQLDPAEVPTDNFEVALVSVTTGDTLCIQPLVEGYYAGIVEAGDYDVFIKFEGNPNWQSCESSIAVEALGTCRDAVDVPLQAITPCSDFSVSIASPAFRICTNSTIFVNYQNIGTAIASPEIKVVLDTSLTYQSSSIPFSATSGDTLIFNVNDLAPLAVGSFWIEAFLDCDVVLGETHCVEAYIGSEGDCEDFAPMWDQSSVQITGSCTGVGTLNIKIENVGTGNMSEQLNYIVIEDNLLLYQTPFQLNIGEELDFQLTPNGSSMLVTSGQSANHPGKSMPSRFYEGCGENNQGTFSLGYIVQYPQDDADPDVSIFCLENVNSYDPNDKQGFPRGVSDAHYIQPNTQLEYMIRFQNTGTAPAIDVLIADPISPNLDHTTLRPGASSHPYAFSMNNGVAEFKFENINLPDSTTNLEASQGFVTFTIEQQPDNLPGTEILNAALIYFDTNNPITTNQTVHRIPLPVITTQEELDICESDYDPDITYTETVEYLFYDNVIIYDPNLLPEYLIDVSVNLTAGEAYQGVIYDSDTTFTESFLTSAGCDSIVNTSIHVLTGTEELIFSELSISPNPTSDIFYVFGLTDSNNKEMQFQMLDQMGRDLSSLIIIKNNNSTYEVDLSRLASGVYILNIEVEGLRKAERVVKI